MSQVVQDGLEVLRTTIDEVSAPLISLVPPHIYNSAEQRSINTT